MGGRNGKIYARDAMTSFHTFLTMVPMTRAKGARLVTQSEEAIMYRVSIVTFMGEIFEVGISCYMRGF
jgi:hypothetical protein